MTCERCGAAEVTATGWCAACEEQHDAWSQRHAADIIWQAFTGAIVAMIVGLGAPLLGLSPIIGIFGVLAGVGTFLGVRRLTTRRRRRAFATGNLPRAYLRGPKS